MSAAFFSEVACAVCFGDPASPLSLGLTMGVLFLLVVTVGILLSFSYFFFQLWKRSKQLADSVPSVDK